MLLLRLVSTALCAACVVLLASFEPVRVELPAAHSPAPAAPAPASGTASTRVRVVDVAAGFPAVRIPSLIDLAPSEYVAAINDRPQSNDLEVGALIASQPMQPGSFLDLTITDDITERRVLVLLH